MERDIATLPYHSIYFFQPSILLGPRKEFRLGEKIGQGFMQLFSFLLMGSFRKFKPIQAADIASSMITAARKNIKGVYHYTYDDIIRNAIK